MPPRISAPLHSLCAARWRPAWPATAGLWVVVGLVLAGCGTHPALPAAEPPPAVAASSGPAPAQPVEAPSPARPAPAQPQPDPVRDMLAYADRVRQYAMPDLALEITRLGDAPETPATQMQLAIALSQTHLPVDLARALGLLQKLLASPDPESLALQPLARLLAARYGDQRRVEDLLDKQAQQTRDSQRRIDQLNERLEAVKAIERSLTARPAGSGASAPQAGQRPHSP
jgi:hypothetical protein